MENHKVLDFVTKQLGRSLLGEQLESSFSSENEAANPSLQKRLQNAVLYNQRPDVSLTFLLPPPAVCDHVCLPASLVPLFTRPRAAVCPPWPSTPNTHSYILGSSSWPATC